VVHDGTTAGGRPLMLESGSNSALALGSAGTPSLKFTDDSNTGIYSPGADQLALSTGGTGRLFVDASGIVRQGSVAMETGLVPLGIVTATNTAAGANFLAIKSADATNGANIQISRSRGTNASPTALLSNDSVGTVVFNSYNGESYATTASIGCLTTAVSGSNFSTAFTFTTNDVGVSSEKLRITSDGRLGLGTSSPSSILHLQNSGADLRIINTASFSTSPQAVINLGAAINSSGTTTVNSRILGGKENATDGSILGNLSFWTNNGASNVERVRIDSSGRVGIGTTGPSALFHLQGTGLLGTTFQQYISDGTRNLRLGVNSTAAEVQSTGGVPLYVNYGGNDVSMFANGPGKLLIGTSTSLGTNTLIQAYKASGELRILADTDSLSNDELCVFQAQGGNRTTFCGVYKHSGITNPCSFLNFDREDGTALYFWADNSSNFRVSSTIGHVGTTSGTVVGTQSSDERIKNILGPVEYGLDTLKQIEPVRYSLKSEPETEKIGFIAQQVQALVPQSVFDTGEHIEGEPEDAPTKLGMEYVALIPVLVNAIKELSAEVDALKTQLEAQ
jgi:hypothetical protein